MSTRSAVDRWADRTPPGPLHGAQPSDGRPITHRARIGRSNRIGITLRTPIG
jgi:hypothetical protein